MFGKRVNHLSHLQKKFETLLDSGCRSDVTLLVDGKSLSAHRLILASASEVFDEILYRSTAGPSTREVVINASYDSVKDLLTYIYTGTADLTNKTELEILDIFELSHRFSITKLEKALYSMVSDMVEMSCIKNWRILQGNLEIMDCQDLQKKCWDIVAEKAVEFVASKIFLDLTEEEVMQFFSMKKLSLLPIEKFQAISKWLEDNNVCTQETKQALLDSVDLNRLSNKQLIKIVSRDPTNLFKSDDIMKIMSSRHTDIPEEVRIIPKKKLLVGENVCTVKNGAKVLIGLNSQNIFKDSTRFCVGKIVNGRRQITINLGSIYLINFISFMLNEECLVYYSIYTSVSADVPYQNHLGIYSSCKKMQKLYLKKPKEVQYITLVGKVECNNFQVLYKRDLSTEMLKFGSNVFLPETAYTMPKTEEEIFHENFVDRGSDTPYVEISEAGIELRLNQPRKLSACVVKYIGTGLGQSFKVEFLKSDFCTVIVSRNVEIDLCNRQQSFVLPPSRISYAIRITPNNCKKLRLTHFEASAK